MIWVLGLPRTGTSMRMRMLDEGGLPAFHEPRADWFNPHGFYEMPGLTPSVLREVAPQLCAVKVFAFVAVEAIRLGVLPAAVLATRRDRAEADASVVALGAVDVAAIEEGGRWERLEEAHRLLADHKIPTLTVDFHHAIDHPIEDARRIAAFLAPWVVLDEAAMAAVPDPALRHFT